MSTNIFNYTPQTLHPNFAPLTLSAAILNDKGSVCTKSKKPQHMDFTNTLPTKSRAKPMTKLANKKCVTCKEGVPPLEGEELEKFGPELAIGWHIVHEHHLEREFHFKDFREALAFTNEVGALAEEEGHHPDIQLSWGKVRIVLWTHKINGLSESDFIFAAKVDQLL